jgi:hypothetical protein
MSPIAGCSPDDLAAITPRFERSRRGVEPVRRGLRR